MNRRHGGKLLCCLLIGWMALAAIAFAGEARNGADFLALGDKEFDSQLIHFLTLARRAEPPLQASDYWRAFENVNGARTNNTNAIQAGLHLGYISQFIAAVGSKSDFTRLLAFADRLPGDSYERRYVMNALLDFAIRLEVDALESQPLPRINLPIANVRMASSVVGAGDEVQAAHRLFMAAESLLPKAQTNALMSAQENWDVFYDTISALLNRRLTNASETIQQFRWGGWCGTGRQMLEIPRSHALFLSFLQERHFGAALGALCDISDESWHMGPGNEQASRQKFLVLCGIDWETFYAAGFVSKPSWSDADWTSALTLLGGEKTARLLGEMAAVPHLWDSSEYLRMVGSFAGPTRAITEMRFSHSPQFGRRITNPAGTESREKLLRVLHSRLESTHVNRSTAELVISMLEELKRPESVAPLKNAMSFPDVYVQEIAARALESMGVLVQRPSALGPAEFRFLVNGKPASGLNMHYEVRSTNGGVSSGFVTGAEGEATIARKWFTDPARPATNVLFTAPRMESLADPAFELQAAVLAELKEPILLKTPLMRVSIRIDTAFPSQRVAGEKMQLSLKAMRSMSYGRYLNPVSREMVMPFTNVVTFAALQPSDYELQIRVAGAAQTNLPFTVKEDSDALTVMLQRGSDIHYEFSGAGGKSSRPPAFAIYSSRNPRPLQIYRHMESRGNLIHGLPVGEYTLHVPSRAEYVRRALGPNEVIPVGAAYRAAEVKFSIAPDSPKLIELGQVILVSE